MKIRNVEKSDLNDLAPLSCLLNKMHVDAYPDIYQRISVEAATNFLLSKLNDSNVIFRLAENESKGIGYYIADIREIEETELFKAFHFIYLAEIMVSPESRSSGVGKALLEDLKNIACEKNIDRIDLDVSGFNSEAHTFFKSQDFYLLRERMSAKIST
jgi:ribosomal protein S18 acetylase RimI-like enzyme